MKRTYIIVAIVTLLLPAVVAPLHQLAGAQANQPVDVQPTEEADPWNFADEEEPAEPTLVETIRQQSLDIGLFLALAALSLIGFFRKSDRFKIATLVGVLLFLGIMRSQLYSVVNIFGLMSMTLPIFTYSIFTYMFWVFTLGTTILWGRLYCGRLCAFGALTQLMDMVVPAKLRIDVPAKIEQKSVYFKYALLAFVLLYFIATRDISIYRYVEPFWMFTGRGSALMWTGLAVLLVATIFVRNLYCRFVCPVGTFLGVIASVTTVFRIKRWAECKTCRICERACEWGAIQGPRIVRSECVRCDDCERIYADQQKCVHWIVIRRKSEVLARQQARA